uniref:Uncharacterized protein n=1 Tax=Anguilla anguilla TaxID=7936 RepID=A0A0E9U9A4_ANGAN
MHSTFSYTSHRYHGDMHSLRERTQIFF